MSSSLNSRIRAQRRVLSRIPGYSIIKVEDDLTYTNTLTGAKSESLQDALTEAGKLRLAEIRRFGPSAGQNFMETGADVVRSEVQLINDYLMNPSNHAKLRSMGLDHLVNGQITGTLMVFNTAGKRSNIESLQSTIQDLFPGETIITDQGLQLFSLSEAITGAGERVKLGISEQFLLKEITGTSRLRGDFVSSFFSDVSQALTSTNEADKVSALSSVGNKLGKMTKRIQSIQSPRDVSFGTKLINQIIEQENKQFSYVYDDIELLLRVAGGDLEGLSPLEKVLMRSPTQVEFGMQSALDAANEAFQTIEYATGLRRADGSYADTATKELSNQIRDLMKEAIENKSPDETVLEYMQKQASMMIDESGNLVKIPEESMDQFGKVIMGLDKNLETFRDGTYWLVQGNLRAALKRKESDYAEEFKRLTINGRSLTKQEQSRLNQLASEIDKTRSALYNHGNERNPARAGFLEGMFKGEGQVSDFSDISGISAKRLKKIESEFNRLKGLSQLSQSEQNQLNYYETVMSAKNIFENFFVIAPRSALKKEVGNQAASIAMNIATSHAEGVYMDPQMALVNPDFFTNQDLQRRMAQNIEAQVSGIQTFGSTGVVPRDILTELQQQQGMDLSILDPSARASALRNRAEAREISNMLKAGVDPRQIPSLVNRVRNHYAIKAFREKGDSVDILIPDAYRYQVTTRGASGMRPSNMSLSGIIQTPTGRENPLNAVEFVTRGNQMVVSDNIAAAYKAALGTFDLDDKVLPVMRTYRDENGKRKIAFISTRDPKGTEEMVLMQPNLRDVETVQFLAGSQDEVLLSRFRSMGQIDFSIMGEELSRLGISSTDTQTAFGIIQAALKANKRGDLFSSRGVQRGLNNASEDAMNAVEAILIMMRERKYDPLVAAPLSEIPSHLIDELSRRGSAAIRGRDVLSSSGRTVAQDLNLGPEQGASYSYKTFVEGRFSGQVNTDTVRKFLDQVNDQLPSRNAEANTQSIIGLFFYE